MWDLVGNPEDLFSQNEAHNGFHMTRVTWTTNKSIMITHLCNPDPLNPHFPIVQLGVYMGIHYFLFLLENRDCGQSLEPPF